MASSPRLRHITSSSFSGTFPIIRTGASALQVVSLVFHDIDKMSSANPAVVAVGFHWISTIITEDGPSICPLMIRLGVIRLICTQLLKHPNNLAIQKKGCEAIARLASRGGVEIRKALIKSGCHLLLVSALARCVDEKVRISGCVGLYCLILAPADRAVVKNLPGLKSVLLTIAGKRTREYAMIGAKRVSTQELSLRLLYYLGFVRPVKGVVVPRTCVVGAKVYKPF